MTQSLAGRGRRAGTASTATLDDQQLNRLFGDLDLEIPNEILLPRYKISSKQLTAYRILWRKERANG